MTWEEIIKLERQAAKKVGSSIYVIDTVHDPKTGEILWVNVVIDPTPLKIYERTKKVAVFNVS